jgi:ornithine cyclodeaminase/alanine dehydrogenase
MDSIEITIKRTAAASAVAAKFLARRDAREATICGCGVQARAQIEALCAVLPLERIYLFDLDEMAGRKLARELENDSRLEVNVTHELAPAVQASDVCVTCTTARKFFLRKEDVRPGTFIAAVGADDKQKQEIDPALMASARVVADSAEQCRAFGDFHHAITAGLATAEGIYAELSAIVAGRTPGRTNDAEIFVFDSTGVAIEDAAAAVVVYEKGERENYQTNSFRFQ